MVEITPDKPRVVVIGAGAAGFSAALELADKGYQVELIEKNTLGSGASGSNPGRMGHGFHYADKETALAYLHASMKVQKKYPGYLIGQDLPFDHPYRHGRYFIVKNSDHPTKTILETYKAINDEYARLVKEDPTNAVFGPPQTFLRTLKRKEYAPYVNADIVEAAGDILGNSDGVLYKRSQCQVFPKNEDLTQSPWKHRQRSD